MAQYRIYSVNEDGAVFGDRFIEAVNDEEAIFAVRSMQRPAPCEIWQRDRRIATIPAYKPGASSAP